MDELIVTPEQLAAILHGDGASKAKANVIRRKCAEGTIVHAEKVCAKWYINASREWPLLFGKGK